MAKIQGLAATALRKSAGKLTFRNTIYGNVASQKIVNMTNPQSIAQSYSRAKTKYLSKGYSLLKKIANHSIEGKVSGAQTMNEWKRLNSQLLANVDKDAKYFYPKSANSNQMPFDGILSKGTLSLNLQCIKDSAVVQTGESGGPIANLITCLQPATPINLSTIKMNEFLKLIGCNYGDELCGIYQTSNAAINDLNITEGYVWNNAEIEYVTFADETKGELNMFTASTYKEGLFTFNPECLTTETQGTGTFMAFIVVGPSLKTTNLMAGVTRAAFIRSAKVDGSWKRSSSRFESQQAIDTLIASKVNAANIDAIYTYSQACETFQKSALPLNNA